MKKHAILVCMLVLLSMSAFAAGWSIKQGEKKVYNLEDKQYEVELSYLGMSGAKFKVNGEITDMLQLGETYALADCNIFKLVSISGNTAEFSIEKPFLTEGQKQVYSFEGKDYEVELTYLSSSGAKFKVNGEVTDTLLQGATYALADGNLFRLVMITPHGVEIKIEGSQMSSTEPSTFLAKLSNYPNMFIKNNKMNTIVVVGDAAPAADVMSAVDIMMGFQSKGIETEPAKLAGEVSDPLRTNLIIVGNPCNNAIAAQFFGDPEPCDKYLTQDQGLIKLFENNGYVQLLVAGYSDEDTRKAAKVLQHFGDYKLEGTEVIVTGTLQSPIIGVHTPTVTPEPTSTTPDIPTSPVAVSPTVPAVKKEICNGCETDSTCLPFGTRLVENKIAKYCDITGSLVQQKEKDQVCQNNYECTTNQCTDNVCGSLTEELKETRGMLQKILDWIKDIFG